MANPSKIVASYSFATFINAIKQQSGDATVEVPDFNENGVSSIATSKGYVELWLATKDREFCGQHPQDLEGQFQVGKFEDGGWSYYTGGSQRTGVRAL